MRSSNEEIYLSMGISKTVYDYGCTIEKSLRDRFDEVDSNAEYNQLKVVNACLLYTSPSPRDGATSRMPSSA